MPKLDEQDELIAFCQEVVGDAFYGIIAYNEDDYELVHIHEGIRAVMSDGQIESVVTGAREIHRVVASVGGVDNVVGQPRTVLTEFQNILTVQVPVDATTGVIVAFDPSVGSNFTDFSRKLAEQIDS